MIKNRRGNALYCFSPGVMIATFAIEVVFLIYTLVRYKMTTLSRLIASMLLFLAIFQLAEYNVCGGMGADAATWSKIGYVAITILPALGIHLFHNIAGKGWNNLTGAAYGMTIAWMGVFTFSETAFAGHVCAGNYVIFQIKPGLGGLYLLYYYFWLFVGTYLCARFASMIKRKKTQESLILLCFGYLALLVPTATANALKPETMDGIPSIMCGFAVILAIILTFGILPRMGKQRKLS